MSHDPRPIGIFDSGIGGLTVVRELHRLLPAEDLLYLGDTARVPYGTKTGGTVTRYADQIVRSLLAQDVKLMVVACNTASALALPALAERYSEDEGLGLLGMIQGRRAHPLDETRRRLPMVGVIRPGAAAAAAATDEGRVGVIGTEGTIRDGAYERALHALRPDLEVVTAACPLFVSLAEEGWIDGEATRLIAEHYLAPVREAEVDTLILGCTHYPLLRPAIRAVMGDGVRLIDSAPSTAERVAAKLADGQLTAPADRRGTIRFQATDNPERFQRVGSHFLGRPIDEVEVVDL